MRNLVGILCVVWGNVFCSLETAHFGYNFSPASPEEVVCDATAVLLVVAGWAILLPPKKEGQP
jgi:uncharacterized membrane protein YdcZ (DUF606 family)